jgi:hypothetical protein
MIRRFLKQKLTRDEFVRSLGRYVLLGVLAMLAAWVLRGRQRRGGAGAAGAAAGDCRYDLPCRRCAELPGCGLARAAATRQAIRSGKS